MRDKNDLNLAGAIDERSEDRLSTSNSKKNKKKRISNISDTITGKRLSLNSL
jgi:hypothetical protein